MSWVVWVQENLSKKLHPASSKSQMGYKTKSIRTRRLFAKTPCLFITVHLSWSPVWRSLGGILLSQAFKLIMYNSFLVPICSVWNSTPDLAAFQWHMKSGGLCHIPAQAKEKCSTRTAVQVKWTGRGALTPAGKEKSVLSNSRWG